jgi:hypothetical protein
VWHRADGGGSQTGGGLYSLEGVNLARDGAVSGPRWKSDGKRLRMHCADTNVSGMARDDSGHWYCTDL